MGSSATPTLTKPTVMMVGNDRSMHRSLQASLEGMDAQVLMLHPSEVDDVLRIATNRENILSVAVLDPSISPQLISTIKGFRFPMRGVEGKQQAKLRNVKGIGRVSTAKQFIDFTLTLLGQHSDQKAEGYA